MKWIISLGGTAVALTAIMVFWSTYGWVTKTAYAADLAHMPTKIQMANITDSLDIIIESQQRNQDQWECNGMDQKIPELREELAEADTLSEQIGLDRDIAKQEEKWKNLACSRFTE